MKERPILFSATMIRTLLEGRKTQTRRMLKIQPPEHVVDFCSFHNPDGEGLAHFGFDPVKRELQDWYAVCPYGQVGDRLWCKEVWGAWPAMGGGVQEDSLRYRADGEYQNEHNAWRWRSPRFMPRWASRITLEITDVRVERLQDISNEDARAEGVLPSYADRSVEAGHPYNAIALYRQLWDAINGEGSWISNPWVWCVSFRKL